MCAGSMNRWHQIFCVGLVCVASNFSLAHAQSSKGTEDEADVQLNSVHFVNSELGWVVGDRRLQRKGLVWS